MTSHGNAEVPSEILASCDFSPGPSWGFNGIRTLVITKTALVVLQRGVAFTARRDTAKTARLTLPLISIRSAATKNRPSVFGVGQVFTLMLSTEHGRKQYTTKYAEDGEEFAMVLEELLDRLR